MRRLTVTLVCLAAMLPSGARAAAPSCAVAFTPTVGAVASIACVSDMLGGETPVSYYVPPACTGASRCPVLYLLHGFGGDVRSMLGVADRPSAFVRALTHDPVTGEDLPDLDLILVAPHGRTVASSAPGAPPADQESFWVDWNPRYWTSPPRFEGFVTDELRALVDASLPTIAERRGRAIDGVSLGGFGSFKLALQHPDLYASAGSISGALNILVAPGPQPVPPGDGLGPGSPVALPYARVDRVLTTPPAFPFGDPFGAFGDPVADEAYFRGNNPLDLALNATGVALRFFHNDLVSRDPQRDLANPASFVGAQALEAAVFPMNIEMAEALTQHGHPFVHELHPGLHSGPYWDPYIRAQLEWHAARLSRDDDPPSSFDFRSIRGRFSAWGWEVSVERTAEEFVTLWDASRTGVTVVGSGRITLVTPAFGMTGIRVTAGGITETHGIFAVGPDGRATITIDLGPPASPTDERLALTGVPLAARGARLSFLYD